MANTITTFITQGSTHHGSSLYSTNEDYVFRVSGNSADGETPTTFLQKDEIVYIKNGVQSGQPSIDARPKVGEHEGDPIVEVLEVLNPVTPAGWNATNGVPWKDAYNEIWAAAMYVENANPKPEKASRRIGHPVVQFVLG